MSTCPLSISGKEDAVSFGFPVAQPILPGVYESYTGSPPGDAFEERKSFGEERCMHTQWNDISIMSESVQSVRKI